MAVEEKQIKNKKPKKEVKDESGGYRFMVHEAS
jgi:hypothetical protein